MEWTSLIIDVQRDPDFFFKSHESQITFNQFIYSFFIILYVNKRPPRRHSNALLMRSIMARGRALIFDESESGVFEVQRLSR